MKIFYTLSLLLFLSIGLQAQNLRVYGTVTDLETGETLTGVSIQEKGTVRGTTTDLDGKYELTISKPEVVLVFTYVGYKASEVPTMGVGEYSVKLSSSTTLLNEVVVTALGLERSSRDLGYAVQRIDGSDISDVKSPNFVDNLAAQVAGVTVSQGATGVGSTSKITIRGEASFTNNNPLFVVDGIPINNNSIINFTNDAAAGFQEVDFGNGGMEINADDVASVSVLKGPSAAALYGTRAANGVIIVTTKNGTERTGLGISFNSTTFVETAFQLPEFQNSYGQGNSGQFAFVDGLGGGTNDNISYSWGPRLDAGVLVPQFDSPVTTIDGKVVRGGDVAVHGGAPITPTLFESHPDNLKNFYETGTTTINNLAIGAGDERGNYRLSFTDMRSNSIIPGVNLDRQTIAAKLGFRPTDRLRINASINYINSNSDNRPANGYGSENINYSLVAWGPRSLNIDNLRDYWQPGLEGIQQYSFNYTFFDNPYFILLENRNSFQRDRVFGNLSAAYDFGDKWELIFRTGMDYSDEDRRFLRNFSSNRFSNGAYAEHNVFYRENNTDLLLNFHDQLGDFSVDISAGANRLDQVAQTSQSQALSLAQPGIFKLTNAASPIEVFDFSSQKRINSVYGIAKLGYKNFLFVDITGRNDWSSALATPRSTDNTSFFYPSVSSSLVLSNLIELPQVVSFAKLRASWAQVGNDTGPYQTTGAFVAQTPFSAQPTFSAQSLIANGNLLPEETSSVEFGADLRFKDDRIRLDVTYYDARTNNQIIALPVPISSGYSEQVVNGGEVRSRGVEVILGLTPIYKTDFRWDAQVNFSTNQATVEELPSGIDRLTLAYSRVYDNVNQTVWFQVEEGGRIGDMYGTGYLRNDNGDFIIDGNGRYIVDNNLQLLGNYNPDFILGFSNRFTYKNWNLGLLLDWRQGGVLVSRTQALAGVAGQLLETENRPDEGIIAVGVVNTGSQENPVYSPNTTAVSAESYYRQYYDRNHEENNTYDASYLKIREFSLGYTFENRGAFLREGRSLKLSLIGRNLYAFSAIPHFDPEQLAVQGSQFVSGVEDMSYATTRSWGLKVGLNF
ncbi:SusC/RagA family TonB-linked outer membrane protein [Lewinella sp. LCG006]|uniref:SusC/RagA family TonB-linked outer membrane protein n=1 Tax=Lewinella sp. LCG006 TaxID=3231911 RepID=UPI003460A130